MSENEKQQTADIAAYLRRQWEWSKQTFGPGKRTRGIIQHITKELREIESTPHDLSEWVDVAILAMDGYWRHGGTPEMFMRDMQAKQDKNFARKWPEPKSEDEAVEHDRSGECERDRLREESERIVQANRLAKDLLAQKSDECDSLRSQLATAQQNNDTQSDIDRFMQAAAESGYSSQAKDAFLQVAQAVIMEASNAKLEHERAEKLAGVAQPVAECDWGTSVSESVHFTRMRYMDNLREALRDYRSEKEGTSNE